MRDRTKHIIANCIYQIVIGVIKEIKFSIKPLAIGLIPLVIFFTIAEWSDVIFGRNCKEPFIFWGFGGFLFPILRLYYENIRN